MFVFDAGVCPSDGEDDVDSDEKSSISKKDIHTINEQRRRDIIKQSYATLEKIVPTCKPNPGSTRLSRATVLLKSMPLDSIRTCICIHMRVYPFVHTYNLCEYTFVLCVQIVLLYSVRVHVVCCASTASRLLEYVLSHCSL